MALVDWIDKVFVGGLGRLEAQHAAQQVGLLELPAEVELGGKRVTIRHIQPDDRDRIVAFARSLPEHDLLFLRRDITSPENVDDWLRDVAAGRYSSLLALVGDAIMGYATVASDGMTWTRHVAELRVLVGPEMRGKGLGSVLTAQSFGMARERGIRKIIAQMTTDQRAAIHTFQEMGFEKEAVLRDQVMDRDNKLHDLQIMALDLQRFHARLAAARTIVPPPGPTL